MLILKSLVAFLLPLFTIGTDFHNLGNPRKIVGGEEATPHEFPFITYIICPNRQFCGGSIIAPEWVVTAAHCLEDYSEYPSWYSIVAGEHNLSSTEETEQIRGVVKIIVHEHYGRGYGNLSSGYENDVALMMVDPPFIFNEYVQPVNLPRAGYATPANATVAGWGALVQGGPLPTVLMKVTVPQVDHSTCNNSYFNNPIEPVEVADHMVCYGEAGKDSCQGDSGGPIVSEVNKTLVGIVSWGFGCANGDYPGVYTDVSKFKGWILHRSTIHTEDPYPLSQSTSCGGYLESTSGRITLSNISSFDYNCVWTISALQESARVILTQSSLLSDDQLLIRRTRDLYIAISEIGTNYTLTGGVFHISLRVPYDTPPTPRSFTLEFYSSGYGIPNGFTGFALLNGTSGDFSYPGGGATYRRNEHVMMVLPPTNPTTITFTHFSTMAFYDEVEVFNRQFIGIFRYSGPSTPPPITLTGGLITFFTRSQGHTHTGFAFNYTVEMPTALVDD